MNKKLIFAFTASVIAAGITFAACAQNTNPPYVPPEFQTSGNQKFDDWRKDFASRAVNVNRKDSKIIESMLIGLTPNPSVVSLNNSQPETIKPVWDYINSAVSNTRVAQGRTNFLTKQPILQNLSDYYGVPTRVAVAIWGMETSYGANKGKSDVIRALATLAYDGRRTELGENELLAIADILKNNYTTRENLVGSWAGAMGHTQFMPSSYLKWSADGDGDGKKDIWNDDNDALASTMNYLKSVGWVANEPWGVKVDLKDDFDYSLADGRMMPISYWKKHGVTINDKSDDNWNMYLLVPAGAKGPKFLVGNNYKAIKHYNNSDSYALSVALLSDRIERIGTMPTEWPVNDPILTRTQAKELQTLLSQLGYDVGVIDGAPGSKTKAELQKFQKAKGLVADGYPSVSALRDLQKSMGIYQEPTAKDDAQTNNIDNADVIKKDASGNPIPVLMFGPETETKNKTEIKGK